MIVTFPGDVPVASSCCVAVPVNIAVAPTPEAMDALAVERHARRSDAATDIDAVETDA